LGLYSTEAPSNKQGCEYEKRNNAQLFLAAAQRLVEGYAGAQELPAGADQDLFRAEGIPAGVQHFQVIGDACLLAGFYAFKARLLGAQAALLSDGLIVEGAAGG